MWMECEGLESKVRLSRAPNKQASQWDLEQDIIDLQQLTQNTGFPPWHLKRIYLDESKQL